MTTTRKTAVVLFNLGGPDSLAAVKPFLFNLFSDPSIISAPRPIRWLIAKAISNARQPEARRIYQHIGGKSPILQQTQAQARALEAALADAKETRVFIAMRHWHPTTKEAAEKVAAYAPTDVLLLPLYPQYSRSTTGSAIAAWHHEAARHGITAPTRAVCCYPAETGFIASMTAKIRAAMDIAEVPVRVLFSAHGLPQRSIDRGDPYQQQVENTARSIIIALGVPELDSQVCYQSRIGPLKWIGPSTESEITRACEDGKAIILVPLSFVSEHSETLVELDIEYRNLATKLGARGYHRVATVQDDASFISGLANMIKGLLHQPAGSIGPNKGGQTCALRWSCCPSVQRRKNAKHTVC